MTIYIFIKYVNYVFDIIYWEYKLVRSVSLDGSSCCEWFIVTADIGDFREVKHLLIIFNLYGFEFHTKTLIFTTV